MPSLTVKPADGSGQWPLHEFDVYVGDQFIAYGTLQGAKWIKKEYRRMVWRMRIEGFLHAIF